MKTFTKFLIIASAIVLCSCPGQEKPVQCVEPAELAGSEQVSEATKQLWSVINAGNAITKQVPGTFQQFRPWGEEENGFSAIFKDDEDKEWLMTYARLEANDGSEVAYVWTRLDDEDQERSPYGTSSKWQQFIYKNGQLQEVTPQIPAPEKTDFPAYLLGDTDMVIEGPWSSFDFRPDGTFWFTAHSDSYQSFGDPEPDAYLYYYEIHYYWDGEQFITDPFDVEEYYRELEESDEEYFDEEYYDE